MPVRECPRCKSKLEQIPAGPPPTCPLCLARYRLALPVVPLACTLRLKLDRFGRESLTARAAAEHVSPDEVVSRAAAHLVSGVHERRPARQLPRGLPESNAQPVELEVALAEREWESLESEAQRRGVALERLLEHALLLYLADVTSGRADDFAPQRRGR